MLKFLVNGGAVPFGYASDMIESDPIPYHHLHRHEMFPQHFYYHTRDQLPLPDVILSNTPPPSPLRRTRSCHAFFPDTPPPSPSLPPTPPLTPGTPRVEEGGTRGEGEYLEQLGMDEASSPPLPELSWPLPPRRHALREETQAGGQGEMHEEERRWRYMGSDLRTIADQFQLNHSKVVETKSQRRRREEDEGEEEEREEQGAMSLSIPSALTRCLSASFFLIICWRIVNKFQ